MTIQKTIKKPPPPPQVQAQGSDPLLDCLVFLTRHFGRAKSADAIKAGLSYDARGMRPQTFCDAAARIGLRSRVTRRSLRKIPAPVLPAVLVLDGGQAVVLMRLDPADDAAWIFTPEDNDVRRTSLGLLEAGYSGYSIFVHSRAGRCDSEPAAADESGKHWFWGSFLDSRWIYARVLIAAILINLFALTSPIFVMTVYDRVIPNNAIATGWVLAIGALTVFLFDFVVRTLRGYFIDFAGRRVDVIAARRIFDQVMDMKLAGRPPSSGVFANMLREFDSVRDFMTSATITALVDLPFALLFLFVIYLLGGPIAFVLASLIGVVIVTGVLLQIPLRNLVRKSVRSAEFKHGLLVESIHGLETVKAIGADGRLRAKYGEIVGENAVWSQKSRFVSALGVNVAAMLQQSATVLVVLLGMYLVRDQMITMGALIACVILGGRAIAPIGQIANLAARYHQASSAMKTLNAVMAKPVERPANKQFLHRPDLKGKIAFDRVEFAYPGTDRTILDGVSFTIDAGEKVGIIGRIGSGKSTIARLMLGLYDPAGGTIMVDDTDHRQIDPADLRRNIGYIAQDVVLFTGTVRENIAISRPQSSDEEILEAAKLAGVHDFIQRHPMGYDAPVGERGEGLSGGQRQAIALARALLTKPRVLVCDEPTNAMDMQAEEAFRTHVRQQAGDMTLVLITHRQQLLPMVDRLILIDLGKVILDGPRDKVLEVLASGKIEVRKE
ncbi:MAG: type I secretion system permease/ATPase [Alphaproteobacteria bacterium]|nr:type I secretion system permease/ATPase [Alphaproteobacteria bacterium]